MQQHSRHAWLYIAAGVIVVVIALGLFSFDKEGQEWLTEQPEGGVRPTTIGNVVLRIDSNILRIQSIMENLVYSEYPKALADEVNTVNRLDGEIQADLKVMGGHFKDDNVQFAQAMASYTQWKATRDEVIRLTADGPSPQAKKLVLGECARHSRTIRAALKAINAFSEKRAGDFDEAAARAHGKRPAD